MKDLSMPKSPIKVHKRSNSNDVNNSTLKRVNDTARETNNDGIVVKDKGIRISDEIRFADESSESSGDIKYADDDTPDSNKFVDKFNIKV